jgi:hypothetical protein
MHERLLVRNENALKALLLHQLCLLVDLLVPENRSQVQMMLNRLLPSHAPEKLLLILLEEAFLSLLLLH